MDDLELVDSHLHLDQFESAERVRAEAIDAGVSTLACVSQERRSMARCLELKGQFPSSVVAALGIHPVEVTGRSDEEVSADLSFMESRLGEADEVGEIGLDHKWASTAAEQERQSTLLSRQIELAAAFSKPINLHSRRCLRQVMDRAIEFHRSTGLNAQLHWFTQSLKLVRICNEHGIYISVGPTVLHQEQTQQVALAIADEFLLLESDAPVSIGGEVGHPRRVREVAEKLADLKGISACDLAKRTNSNFRRFLGP